MKWSPLSDRHRAVLREIAPSIAAQIAAGVAPTTAMAMVATRDVVNLGDAPAINLTSGHTVAVRSREFFRRWATNYLERADREEWLGRIAQEMLDSIAQMPLRAGIVPVGFVWRTPTSERCIFSGLHVFRLARRGEALPVGRLAARLRDVARAQLIDDVLDAYNTTPPVVRSDDALIVRGWRHGSLFVAMPLAMSHRDAELRRTTSRNARADIEATPSGHVPLVIYGGAEMPVVVVHIPIRSRTEATVAA